MRYQTIKELYNEVMSCSKCRLSQNRKSIVFGEGNIHADILFIGEGPGAREDETGRPFVGPAGKLLDNMLGDIGLKREDVYIANVVKCRPPGNRDPQPDERECCIGYLRAQVAFIKPKVIVCLGRISAGVILGREVRMMREHGTPTRVKNFTIIPTFHPAALLHNPDHEKDARADFQIIAATVKEMQDA
ncbi:uracil-DNA glycosylase [Christensenellaceae bacterium OttesenSCG-928-K19]|nr:uracil-DNA glycosylase [Christensenellaceae bacterium OttesenSCG-928-K19]